MWMPFVTCTCHSTARRFSAQRRPASSSRRVTPSPEQRAPVRPQDVERQARRHRHVAVVQLLRMAREHPHHALAVARDQESVTPGIGKEPLRQKLPPSLRVEPILPVPALRVGRQRQGKRLLDVAFGRKQTHREHRALRGVSAPCTPIMRSTSRRTPGRSGGFRNPRRARSALAFQECTIPGRRYNRRSGGALGNVRNSPSGVRTRARPEIGIVCAHPRSPRSTIAGAWSPVGEAASMELRAVVRRISGRHHGARADRGVRACPRKRLSRRRTPPAPRTAPTGRRW